MRVNEINISYHGEFYDDVGFSLAALKKIRESVLCMGEGNFENSKNFPYAPLTEIEIKGDYLAIKTVFEFSLSNLRGYFSESRKQDGGIV